MEKVMSTQPENLNRYEYNQEEQDLLERQMNELMKKHNEFLKEAHNSKNDIGEVKTSPDLERNNERVIESGLVEKEEVRKKCLTNIFKSRSVQIGAVVTIGVASLLFIKFYSRK
ncbi:hypothetical protein A0H76_572 [Hepatospora eriocheir]|uniref:Uncharacterized protein n=1 Tax=Hepatospora eriocheir TaxID=1081669 RepID=A0A1X0QIL7_9MICR|nr:hypothetical protein A0H76_572 [Hepatospora eriocheir]